MHCASCARNVEINVGKLPGVESVSVNLVAGNASVVFDENAISCGEIIKTINSLGYKASLPSENDEEIKENELKSETVRLVIAV